MFLLNCQQNSIPQKRKKPFRRRHLIMKLSPFFITKKKTLSVRESVIVGYIH